MDEKNLWLAGKGLNVTVAREVSDNSAHVSSLITTFTVLHGWKCSGLFLNSGFWGWLSIEIIASDLFSVGLKRYALKFVILFRNTSIVKICRLSSGPYFSYFALLFWSAPTFPYFFMKMPYFPYFFTLKCQLRVKSRIFFLARWDFINQGLCSSRERAT